MNSVNLIKDLSSEELARGVDRRGAFSRAMPTVIVSALIVCGLSAIYQYRTSSVLSCQLQSLDAQASEIKLSNAAWSQEQHADNALRGVCPPSAMLAMVTQVVPEGIELYEFDLQYAWPDNSKRTLRRFADRKTDKRKMSIELSGVSHTNEDLLVLASSLTDLGFKSVKLNEGHRDGRDDRSGRFRLSAASFEPEMSGGN